MLRIVEPEWLDDLPVTDPRAVHSRHDLRRLNAVMGNARFISSALSKANFHVWGRCILDLGGGDGRFLLRVARKLRASNIDAFVVDRLNILDKETAREFESICWRAKTIIGDVFEVLEQMATQPGTAVISNLFLHHFADDPLRRLLALIVARADLVVACEPRRAQLPMLASRLIGLIGCNDVTRHDAVVSVRAGFRNADLTHLLPATAGWTIEESSVGLFSHGFVCRRNAK